MVLFWNNWGVYVFVCVMIRDRIQTEVYSERDRFKFNEIVLYFQS